MSAFSKFMGGLALALAVTAIAIAVWPASEAEKAREDGEQLGQAVAQLQDAETQEEVDAAWDDVVTEVETSVDHGGDAVAEQADKQAEMLDWALDSYAGAVDADDEFEQDVYETELDYALTELESNAEEFRTSADDVVQSYWEGFDEGLSDEG